MRLEQPPLLHDGGYWYVVPVVYDELEGYAPAIDITNWCAWYSDDMTQAVVRSPIPVAGLKTVKAVSDIPMLRGRIGGV